MWPVLVELRVQPAPRVAGE